MNAFGVTCKVAPFTGARVETTEASSGKIERRVAPFTGARVETLGSSVLSLGLNVSLPSRERELKRRTVEPINRYGCRSLHGSVS